MNSEAASTLSREEIATELSQLAAPHLAVTQLRPGATLGLDQRLIEDLGLDSISLLALVVEVENHFRVVLEPEDEAGIERVGDLVDAIASRRR
ncbi:MAG: acyl carrier protein [Thermoanaerobaculia bacterium]|nr:acyl carrier protein [Thermoanaerobaculia bacterium]